MGGKLGADLGAVNSGPKSSRAVGAPRPAAWGGRSVPCRLRRQALSAIRVAIRLIVRILDPSREFYAARLACVCVCSYTETDTLLHVFSVGTQA